METHTLTPSACQDMMKSLNRTMQYGNSVIQFRIHRLYGMFKSYYVVWKPFPSNPMISVASFKSYYVVWKLHSYHLIICFVRLGLNRTMQYGNFSCSVYSSSCCRWFKSYYVVWKLKKQSEVVGSISGLNRTMQYGNKKKQHIWKQTFQCLNRTMQYGNPSADIRNVVSSLV